MEPGDVYRRRFLHHLWMCPFGAGIFFFFLYIFLNWFMFVVCLSTSFWLFSPQIDKVVQTWSFFLYSFFLLLSSQIRTPSLSKNIFYTSPGSSLFLASYIICAVKFNQIHELQGIWLFNFLHIPLKCVGVLAIPYIVNSLCSSFFVVCIMAVGGFYRCSPIPPHSKSDMAIQLNSIECAALGDPVWALFFLILQCSLPASHAYILYQVSNRFLLVYYHT